MADERPLASAQRRLGRPGRPRKTPAEALTGHTAGTPSAPTRMDAAAARGSTVPQASALAPRVLDVDGAAHYLGVSSWSIRDLYASGRLARVRLPLEGDRELRRLLFDRRDLDQLIEASKDRAP
jgi:hypothetical protein